MPFHRLKDNVLELRPQRLGACRVYVVIDGDSWVIIDAGNHGRTPAQICALRRELSLPPPKAALITHWHPDHLGGASELRRRWGVPVALHGADHDYAAGRLETRLSPIGWAEHVFADNHPRPLEPDIVVEDGMEFTVGSLTLRAVHTPGHTPGHTAYHLPRRRTLFTGDALGGKGGTILNEPRLFGARPEESIGSMRRMARLDFDLLCGGHRRYRSPELPGLLSRYADGF